MHRSNQSGQGLTEYIIIVGLIAVALIAVVAYFGLRTKQTVARSGTALAGDEAAITSEAEPDPAKSGAASGQGGAPARSSSSSSAAGGGDAATAKGSTPSVVAGGGGDRKLSPEFKEASRPEPGSYEVKEESGVIAIPETSDSDALAAFAGKVDGRGSSSTDYAMGGGSGGSPGFPVGLLALILLVAVGGGFVMVFLMRRQ